MDQQPRSRALIPNPRNGQCSPQSVRPKPEITIRVPREVERRLPGHLGLER